jgi:hypothetical protein
MSTLAILHPLRVGQQPIDLRDCALDLSAKRLMDLAKLPEVAVVPRRGLWYFRCGGFDPGKRPLDPADCLQCTII